MLAELGDAETLECLGVLSRSPARSFSADEVGRALHRARSVEPALERLASLNLLDVRLREEVTYRYAPGSPALDATVREITTNYATRRLAVLQVLGATSSMRAFADAFRFGEKKKG